MIVVLVETQKPGDSFRMARTINVMCQGRQTKMRKPQINIEKESPFSKLKHVCKMSMAWFKYYIKTTQLFFYHPVSWVWVLGIYIYCQVRAGSCRYRRAGRRAAVCGAAASKRQN